MDDMAIARISILQGTLAGSAGLGCGCGIGCNFGLIFLLLPVLPSPFLGSTGGIFLGGVDTDLHISGMDLGIPTVLAHI